MRSAILLAAATATGLSAQEPLMTDLRLTLGGGQRDYDVAGADARFDDGLDVALQFLWSRNELAPSGSFFFGGQAAFADRRDDDIDFALSTFTVSGLAGFAVAPEGFEFFHAEIGVIGGLGGAMSRGAGGDEVSPWIEGGVRAAGILTWEQLQVGLEIGYRMGLAQLDVGTGSRETFALRGLTAALGLGMRIE